MSFTHTVTPLPPPPSPLPSLSPSLLLPLPSPPSLPDTLALLHYGAHTNTAALALAISTNITMTMTNGVSSSSHVTELTDQVIEMLLVGEFSHNSVGLRCLLQALVKLSSLSGSASKAAIDTLLSLLPQFTGEWTVLAAIMWDYVHDQVNTCICCVMLWLSWQPVLVTCGVRWRRH